MIEELAALQHSFRSAWLKRILEDSRILIPDYLAEKMQEQICSYDDLSEADKFSALEDADKVMDLLKSKLGL